MEGTPLRGAWIWIKILAPLKRCPPGDSVSTPIVVVAAVIERDDAFLLTLRSAGAHLEGHWEFPGGKCEPTETHDEALRRELFEELDIVADVGERVHQVVHTYPERVVELHFYRCRFRGDPKPMLGQDMRWVPRHELTTLPFPEADWALVRTLAQPRL